MVSIRIPAEGLQICLQHVEMEKWIPILHFFEIWFELQIFEMSHVYKNTGIYSFLDMSELER